MAVYSFTDHSDTVIKMTEGASEILFKKVYCSTSVSGDYMNFMAHDLETGKMIQQYAILYTDCTSPSESSALDLQTAIDLIINGYAGGVSINNIMAHIASY